MDETKELDTLISLVPVPMLVPMLTSVLASVFASVAMEQSWIIFATAYLAKWCSSNSVLNLIEG